MAHNAKVVFSTYSGSSKPTQKRRKHKHGLQLPVSFGSTSSANCFQDQFGSEDPANQSTQFTGRSFSCCHLGMKFPAKRTTLEVILRGKSRGARTLRAPRRPQLSSVQHQSHHRRRGHDAKDRRSRAVALRLRKTGFPETNRGPERIPSSGWATPGLLASSTRHFLSRVFLGRVVLLRFCAVTLKQSEITEEGDTRLIPITHSPNQGVKNGILQEPRAGLRGNGHGRGRRRHGAWW